MVSSLDGAVSLVQVDDVAEFITCGGMDNREMRGEDGCVFCSLDCDKSGGIRGREKAREPDTFPTA